MTMMIFPLSMEVLIPVIQFHFLSPPLPEQLLNSFTSMFPLIKNTIPVLSPVVRTPHFLRNLSFSSIDPLNFDSFLDRTKKSSSDQILSSSPDNLTASMSFPPGFSLLVPSPQPPESLSSPTVIPRVALFFRRRVTVFQRSRLMFSTPVPFMNACASHKFFFFFRA